MACHGLDGKGVKAGELTMAPSLLESDFVKGDNADPLGAIILKGILKEDNQFVQAMLPLEAALSDEQLAAVVTYVRSEFGERSKTVKPERVKKWRKNYQSQASPWKRSDLAGLLENSESAPYLNNIKFSVYKGNWNNLPDFSKMEPVQRGEIKNGKLTLDVVKDLKDGFGVVFQGDLIVQQTETYEFSLLSDDGSALVIDGEGVISNDGIHGAQTKTATEKLEEGRHTFKVLYFERGGHEALALAAKSKSTGLAQLSKQSIQKGGGAKSYDPIVLKPKNGEAIVHRAFLPDANPRAIAVGYPGGINLAWDADVLNLAYLWWGDFVDAAPHWNGRGSKSTPLGKERIGMAPGVPLATLESLDTSWPPLPRGRIKYERDNAEPQKEISFHLKPEGYQFLGYRLDKKRYPTFLYRYGDLKIADRFEHEQSGDGLALARILQVNGTAPGNLYFRLSNRGPGKADATDTPWIDLGKMEIRIEGAEPVFRLSESKNEVLLRVTSDLECKVTYRRKE